MVIDIDAGSADGLHRWRRRILDTVVLHRVVKVLQRAYCIGAGPEHSAAGPASVGIERTQVCRTSGPCFGSWRCQQRGPLHEKCRKQPVREKKQPELRREERVLWSFVQRVRRWLALNDRSFEWFCHYATLALLKT